MYLWNIKALKKNLSTKALTEAETFWYFFAVLTLDTLFYNMTSLFPGDEPLEVWDYVEYLGAVIFTIGGTYVAYRANGGASGQHFLSRYFPIIWVLTIRFLVFMIPILIVAGFVMFSFTDQLFGAEAEEADFPVFSRAVLIASWIWFLVFYYRLAVHMRGVAKAA